MRILKKEQVKNIDAEFIYDTQKQFVAIITEREKEEFEEG